MRVAVRVPQNIEADGTVVPEHTFAFRLGRVEDHTDPVTGVTESAEERTAKLKEIAAGLHPKAEVVVERLVDNGDGTSAWVHEDEVPEGAVSPDGKTVERALSAEQGQDASTGGQS